MILHGICHSGKVCRIYIPRFHITEQAGRMPHFIRTKCEYQRQLDSPVAGISACDKIFPATTLHAQVRSLPRNRECLNLNL